MKKRILFMATVIVGLGFTACSVDSSGLEDAANDMEKQLEEASEKMEEEIAEMEKASEVGQTYQCPTDCDNGPVYDEAGPCNKCGEEMVVL